MRFSSGSALGNMERGNAEGLGRKHPGAERSALGKAAAERWKLRLPKTEGGAWAGGRRGSRLPNTHVPCSSSLLPAENRILHSTVDSIQARFTET